MTPALEPPDSSAEMMRNAVSALRGRTHDRSVEIASDVLRNAMLGQRRSQPVRAHAPYDFVRVGDRVIVAELSRRIDATVSNAAVGRIVLETDREDNLQQLTIELFVRYGEVLLDVADQTREVADQVLAELLAEDSAEVSVRASHVHVSDITVGDPKRVDPLDE